MRDLPGDPGGKIFRGLKQGSGLTGSFAALRMTEGGWNARDGGEQSLSHGFAVPAPFTQGSLPLPALRGQLPLRGEDLIGRATNRRAVRGIRQTDCSVCLFLPRFNHREKGTGFDRIKNKR